MRVERNESRELNTELVRDCSRNSRLLTRILQRFIVLLAFVGAGAFLSLFLFWHAGSPRPRVANVEPLPLQIQAATPVDGPLIRVNLTPTRVRQLDIAIDGPYRIRPMGQAAVKGTGRRLKPTKVVATSRGLRIGSNEYSSTRLQIEPVRSPGIWINDHQYRGNVRLIRRSDGTLIAVNVVALEEYLASVVDSEMPAAFPAAARRAQAIVARTYALDRMQSARNHPYFHLDATARSQKYLGYQYRTASGRRLAGESANSRRIVSETTGMVCTHQGKLFRTYYSAVCGGRTTVGRVHFADAAEPLKSVVCQWCRAAKYYRWQTELPKQDVSDTLRRYFLAKGEPFGRLTSMTRRTGSAGGAVPEFVVADSRRKLIISATHLRRQLPASTLYSPYFSVREAGGRMIFAGRGHGHCAGMCQWGARGLALAGRNCVDIIRYYYPGAKVVVFSSEGK